MKEVWKKIPGFARYKCSNKGRVKSFVKDVPLIMRATFKQATGRRGGSVDICLTDDRSNRRYKTVASLVWVTFKGKIPKGKCLDHINRNPQDNRLCNLRLATPSQNRLNSDPVGRRKLKGVYKQKNGKPYMVMIHLKKGHVYLGTYSTEKEASNVYNTYINKHYREFGVLNN